MCLYPKMIKNKKYTRTKKNGGNIPAVTDERTLYVPVGCGKCIECMKQKSRAWQVRLYEEIKSNNNGKFVTLTFNDKSLKELTKIYNSKYQDYKKIEENEIARIAVRRFLERWRKKYKKSVRHWLVTELGHNGTERIHLHGIIFTDEIEEIKKIWQYGIVWIGEFVNEKTISYIVKYINKIDIKNKGYQPKVLCSAGIGSNYTNRPDSKLNKYNKTETKEYYRTKSGIKLNLPIYYRNKIYSEEEKELLWLQKLDKNIRFVCGEKIDISINDNDYYKTLQHYRERNKKLGYGDESEIWSIKRYKEQRRELKERQRKKN